ncbi:anti-repressor SinI family protein [Halobacillus yeomjeoni]|nr:DNA-binding anti-repressor SinI [Halobacillus yeomjeoni]MCA0985221.1 anti-repressor SinI family protein [Halobacillus yeomjeoni]
MDHDESKQMDEEWVTLIKEAKNLGYSIEELKTLLSKCK